MVSDLLVVNASVRGALGVGIAQLVERSTEKTGAILTRVRVPGAAKLLFLPSVHAWFKIELKRHVVVI